jgi:hypothetical protein
MVASKYFLAWRELLIHVFKRKESRLSNSGLYRGKTLGVDVSSWFQADMQLHRDYAFGLGWRFQHYTPERIMEMFQRRHEKLLQLDVIPLYVFPGRVNPKRLFRDREFNALEKMRDFYRLSRERRIMNASAQKKDVCSTLHLCHLIHPHLIPFLVDWMKNTLGVPAEQIINAPFETVWQLRELERTNITSGSFSNDCTLAMIGGQKILVFAKFTGKKLYYQKFEYGKDIEYKKYNHDFRGLSDYLPEAMTLFETDYYQRVNVGAKDAIKKVFPNYVIDHQRWLMNGGGTNYDDPHNPPPMDRNFAMAANMLRYGPVVRSYPSQAEDDSSSIYKIEPLNPLPVGVTWREAIGFDPITDVLYDIAPSDYEKAMRFTDGHSFIVPPSSQPSNIPGFDEMRCVMPKKAKPKRLSKKEKKQLRARLARGEVILPDDDESEQHVVAASAGPQAEDDKDDMGKNDEDNDDDDISSGSSTDGDTSDVHSGTDQDDDSDDDDDDDSFSDDDDDDEAHPDDTTTPADQDDDEPEHPSPSKSKHVKTDDSSSSSETKHGTTTATTTISTSSPANG